MYQPNEKLLDRSWLYDEYITKQLSMITIAKNIGVTTAVVSKYIKRHEIPVRSAGASKSLTAKQAKTEHKLLSDKGWLYQKYIVEKMALRTIAKLCDDYRRNVKKALKQHNIPIRNLRDARSSRSSKGPEYRTMSNPLANDLSYIKSQYETGKSISTLAEELDLSADAIRHRIHNSGVEVRDSWEHRIGSTHSAETLAKMSATASQQILDGTRTSYSHGNRMTCLMPSGDFVRMRSSWEKRYAEYLKQSSVDFLYENKQFPLSNGKSYVADFYLPATDEYVEIKGYLSDGQSEKYELFRKEYPAVKWKILYREHLIDLGIDLNKRIPTVYLLCGVSGSGKSWIAAQVLDKCTYVSFDKVPKPEHLSRIMSSGSDVLYDPTYKISTFIRRHSHELNIIPIFILEGEDIIKTRLEGRGGSITASVIKRIASMQARAGKYGVFSGTSDQVFRFLQLELDMSNNII